MPQPGIRSKEEGLVALYGAADGATVLVAMKRRPCQLRAPVIGVENGVAHKLKEQAMILVGPGLRKHVDDAAGKAAILRIVAVGLNTEFLDGIRVGQDVASVA